MEKAIYDAKQDPVYQTPFVDLEEERIRILPDGRVLPFTYVHGGFAGTKVKFSFCFPPKDQFTGRFFQYLSPFPGPDEEMASLGKTGEDDKIAFCLVNGAYYVETNMGSSSAFGPSSHSARERVYQSSAAAAEYSRVLAMERYGCSRPYGYVYGGSGGGYKTMACAENTNAWDGAVPYVIGSPVSLPNTITMHVQGQRRLRRVFREIVDALDAGGSGDPYEGLTKQEAQMLRELTSMGFPPKAWFLEAAGQIDDGSLPVLAPLVVGNDPGYFKDFWQVQGYLGADRDSAEIADRIQLRGVVKQVHLPGISEEPETEGRNGVDDAWKKMLTQGNGAWIELEELPQGDLYWNGVQITFETGAATGKKLLLGGVSGNRIAIGLCYGMDDLEGVLSQVKAGDQVFLDNSDYIALQSYYRHQVPDDPAFHGWDQFRDEKGIPTLPQRENVLGYGLTGAPVQDGKIQCKMLIVQALMDESTCPWCADWYVEQIRKAKGTDQDVRLYYMDRCLHGDVAALESNMVVGYLGALYQALLDLSDWVERGVEPLPSTVYTRQGGIILPQAEAAQRRGMQPTVKVTAQGLSCAHVKAGETVRFVVEAQVPQGAGKITAVDYDPVDISWLPGKPVFQNSVPFTQEERQGIVTAHATFTHVYPEPGTYFASVRVKANRNGDSAQWFTQVKNLARVRVVVEK